MEFKYQPQTREELIQIIKDETQRQLDEAYDYIEEDDDRYGLVTIDLNFIDVSKITDMSYVFNQAISWENKDLVIKFDDFQGFYLLIDKWDVSNVTNMQGMFQDVEFRADLYDWNVSNVKDMRSMFYCCGLFDSNLCHWDVSKVEYMDGIFCEENYCFDVNTIRNWNVSSLKDKTDYERIFEELEMC
jgi:hypothetical protein